MDFKKKVNDFFSSELNNKSVKVLFIRILGVIVFFTLTLFLTNFFPAFYIGRYDFSRSLLLLLSGFSVLGMNQSILYFSGYLMAKNRLSNIRFVYQKMIFIIASTSVVLIGVFLLFNKHAINVFFEKDIYDLVLKSVLILFFYSTTILNIDVFRAINRIFVSETYRSILRYLPFFALNVILYLSNNVHLVVDAFLISFVFTGVFSTIYLLFILKKKYPKKTNLNNKISIKEIIKKSSPMAISAIAYIMMQGVDIILIGKFLDFNAVAYYSVAVKLTMIISLALSSVNAVNSPTIAKLNTLKDSEGLKQNLKKASRLIFILTIPAIIILAMFSGLVLGLFGEDYILAQNALYILLIGQTVNALCGSVGVYMNMTNRQRILQNLLIIAFFINLILNWVLIPKYGMIGAAVATSISMIFWNVAGVVYLLFKDNIKTYVN